MPRKTVKNGREKVPSTIRIVVDRHVTQENGRGLKTIRLLWKCIISLFVS